MNYGIVARIIGKLILIEGACLIFPLLVCIYYRQEDWLSFLFSIGLCAAAGLLILCSAPSKNRHIKIREAFCIVALGWLLFSVFGAFPFFLSGAVPHYLDAFFESVAGFTTTGASILSHVEHLPKGLLFWRAFSYWLGGMGILAFTVAVLPAMDAGSFQIIKAEFPGPTTEKIAPRVKDTAKIFYFIYIGLTLAEIIFLTVGGMDLFDAVIHAFGTVSTGGVSSKDASIGHFFNNPFIIWGVTIFMALSGINFVLYYFALKTKIRYLFKSEEVRLYLGIILIAILIISYDLHVHGFFAKDTANIVKSASFHVVSIVTTTGFVSNNFDIWPTVSKAVLFLLFFTGGCAGSTGGGIKMIRFLVCAKAIKQDLMKVMHPHAVTQIKIDQKPLAGANVSMIKSFILLYLFLFAIGTVLISFEGVDLATASSSVAVTLGNIGFGFGLVGPAGDFGFFSGGSKLLLAFFMLAGRLELFTVLALFTPSFWKD